LLAATKLAGIKNARYVFLSLSIDFIVSALWRNAPQTVQAPLCDLCCPGVASPYTEGSERG